MLSRQFNHRGIIWGIFLIFIITMLNGCASNSGSILPQASSLNSNSPPEDFEQKKQEFVEMVAAICRRFGKDAIARGYALVFTDIGPEGLEESWPDLFNLLITKASTKEVTVRGLSRVAWDAESVYDKETGENGVCFGIGDMEEDGRGGYVVTAFWQNAESTFHDVKYHLVKKGKRWVAK